MPDMESDEFLRLLRADPDPALAGTRVVVMTGSVPSAAHSPSPDDYLLRPFRTSALLRALEPAEEQSRRQAS